jgi:AcrR family transcriptional regulator
VSRHRPPGRRDRKKRELRERLLGEAQRLFVTQGYWRTTVEEIAEAADVTPATFFNYFPSKQHALNELAGQLFEALTATLEAAHGSVPQRLARFAEQSAAVLVQAHERLGVLVLRALRAAASGEGGLELARLRGALTELLAGGRREGTVRRDVDVPVLAEMSLGALLAVLIRWLEDPRYPVEARLSEAAAFIGSAVAAPRSVHHPSEEATN